MPWFLAYKNEGVKPILPPNSAYTVEKTELSGNLRPAPGSADHASLNVRQTSPCRSLLDSAVLKQVALAIDLERIPGIVYRRSRFDSKSRVQVPVVHGILLPLS